MIETDFCVRVCPSVDAEKNIENMWHLIFEELLEHHLDLPPTMGTHNLHFWGYDPYIENLKPSFFMGFGGTQ